ncbi:hypothetical protein BMG03_08110 [Thioclava nitratireducens]|uniref:TPR repeat n=1 Tax=Thioclava nitratireducens TaxID=1915078 RepID=A0ABM6IG65_9RHOB|nr:SEL1-like repeat protein [Thioclava nitratireducens]AQS47770.1 hypothetical protein BMG03_08110 [Thioclava nitratireducens]
MSRKIWTDTLGAFALVLCVAGGAVQAEETQPDTTARAHDLIWGTPKVPADPETGLAMLERAASEGNAQAARMAGELLLWGGPVPTDRARAMELLSQAADAGDAGAARVLGEQLLGGWVLPRDTDRGRALLEAQVKSGNRDAAIKLGEAYLYGIGVPRNREKARDLFETATEAGDATGLWKFGEEMMWSQRDPAAAETMLQRAGAAGIGSAYATLAEGAMYGYLGSGKVSRAKFDGYAKAARAAGNERIEVLDATRRIWGISMRGDGKMAVAQLREAAEAGNRTAARYLVGLLRDGNAYNVRRDPKGASTFLEAHADLFTPEERANYEMTIRAAMHRHDADFAPLVGEIAPAMAKMSAAEARDLFKANPRLAVYLIQKHLAKQGLYRGPLDGFAGRGTLRAMERACGEMPGDMACRDGVLAPEIVGAMLRDGWGA